MAGIFRITKRMDNANHPSNVNRERRLLHIEVVEARNILGISKSRNGDVSDAYVLTNLVDLAGRNIPHETFKTTIKGSSITPVWNERFAFGQKFNLDVEDDQLPSVNVLLFHKSTFSVSETPLGAVQIYLDGVTGIDPWGKVTDNWYPIQPTGRMSQLHEGVTQFGEIHLRLKFSRAPIQLAHPSLELGEDVESPGGLDDTEAEELESQPPNELMVNCVAGHNLLAVDKPVFSRTGGTSDPLVRFKIEGFPNQETPYIQKNLNPRWNYQLVWPRLFNAELSLTVIVEDFNNLTSRTFMGKVVIPLAPFEDKKRVHKRYKLRNRKNEDDGENRGEIELEILWRFNVQLHEQIRREKEAFDNSVIGKIDKGFKGVGKAIGSQVKRSSVMRSIVGGDVDFSDSNEDEGEETEGEGDQEVHNDEAQPQQTEAELAVKKLAEDELRKDLSNIEIKDGDYQIQVHIIEARDLKAENLDGTSDPVCYIQALGSTQNTKTIYGVTSCVFDDLLIFNYKDLEKEQFEEGIIRIAVYDANSIPGAKKTMIGSFTIDAMQVYTSDKNHELYRQWVPLMDDEDADDIGVQGYLKISITILGPGDKIHIHDEDADIAKEQAEEIASGGDIGSLCLRSPVMTKSWHFVVVSIYRCEALPVMDGKIGGVVTIAKAGTDAFCQVSFAGGKPVRTKIKTIKAESRDAINPEFNYEIWYKVSVPTMTQMIKFSVWDWDPDKNELIGNIIQKYDVITRNNNKLAPTWYNMYGAPEFKTDGIAKTLVRGGKLIKDVANQTFLKEKDWYTHYNYVPDSASTFKGRALLGFRIETQRPPGKKYNTPEIVSFRRKMKHKLPKNLEPPSSEYVLKALVICGTELPEFTQIGLSTVTSAGQKKQELRVKISVGHFEISTKKAKHEKGMCRWNEMIRTSGTIKLPSDPTQLPDIFVYLCREDNLPVCFTRIKSFDPKTGQLLGFDGEAEWHLLKEDKVIKALEGEFPGNLLLKLGFGLARDAKDTSDEWATILDQVKNSRPHQVRVHIYQGKNLPAADSNGLIDPYIQVNFMGQTQRTATKYKTRFPCYYQTLVFNDVTLPMANNYAYAPMVNFRLYDSDDIASGALNPLNLPPPGNLPTGPLFSEYQGTFGYNLQYGVRTEGIRDESNPLPDPKWFDFLKEVPGDTEGSLLVLVELIPGMAGQETIAEAPPSIEPQMRSAVIEVIAVGCRDLAPYNFLPIQAPYLHFEIDSHKTVYKSRSQISKRPSPQNPNFLDRILINVQLPLKSIYASPLCISVKDSRLGGFVKPTVGVCAIDLVQKLPWCKDTYEKPCSQTFISEDAVDDFAVEPDSPFKESGSSRKDSVSQKANNLQMQRQQERAEDDFIAHLPPPSVDEYIKARRKEDDTGAGVFGALHHIKVTGMKPQKGPETAFSDPDWSLDDGDTPPSWAINRKKLEGDLESELTTAPFETYPLMRGKKGGHLGFRLKQVGVFKCIVRVMESEDEEPLFKGELMESLLKPKKYKVRLYVLRALKLTPMDIGLDGKPSKSDPYLRVKLGKSTFDDREHAIDNAVDVDLYKCIEFDAELPGTSQLIIDVMDKDDFGPYSDDLIGRTIMDLEDRWFDARWQELGQENRRLPAAVGTSSEEASKPRWCTKPIETRSIYVPSNKAPQGALECWLDILKPEAAAVFPCDDVSLPPRQIFEVRIVIWKAKNVPAMDSLEGMSDLFVKAFLEGSTPHSPNKSILPSFSLFSSSSATSKPLETDTHWRAKKNKASWNYRLIFDVELGHNTRAMKFPYLKLQLWDRDILKYNDCVGEGSLDLGKYYRKAYKRNVALKLFESKQGAAAKREAREAKKREAIMLAKDTRDIVPEETSGVARPTDGADGKVEGDAGDSVSTRSPFMQPKGMSVDIDSDDDEEAIKAKMSAASAASASSSVPASPSSPSSSSSLSSSSSSPRTSLVGGQKLPLVPQSQITADIKAAHAARKSMDGTSSGKMLSDASAGSSVGGGSEGLRRRTDDKIKTGKEGGKGEVMNRDIDADGDKSKDKKKSSWFSFFSSSSSSSAEESSSLLVNGEANDMELEGGMSEAEKQKAEDDDDAKELVQTIKAMTGLFDDDPPDSDWMHFTKHDHNTNAFKPMGSVCYSVQIWPKDKAVAMPVGAGRNEPNNNPYLPPPVGRLKWSWNPFVLGSELCGPKICSSIFCCLICIAFVLLMVFCQPFLNIIINLVFLG